MKHPTEAELAAYARVELSEEEAEAIHLHLEQCQICAEAIESLDSESTSEWRVAGPGAPHTADLKFADEAECADLMQAVVGQDLPSDNLSESHAARGAGLGDKERGQSDNDATLRYLPAEESRFVNAELHAQGGLGEVFKARDRQLNRIVAIKEIKDDYADDAAGQERFVREAEITGRLEHPGVVPVYALGNHADGRPYYAMRFIRGNTLKDAIAEYHGSDKRDQASKSLGMRKLLAHFIDVCDTIYYAHRRSIVHRDIKPSNIMLGDYGETLVVDWGLAKTVGKREKPTSTLAVPVEKTLVPASGSSASNTVTGIAMGTPAYMSPEQARGEDEITFASDIYGLGATLYMILTGRPWVDSKSSAEALRLVRSGKVPPPRTIVRSVPKPLEAICLKAMALEPEDRYGSVRQLRNDLERFLADEKIAAYREHWWEAASRLVRRRRALVPTLLVSVVGLIVLASVSQYYERTRQEARSEADQANELTLSTVEKMVPLAIEIARGGDEPTASSLHSESIRSFVDDLRSAKVPEAVKLEVYDKLVSTFEPHELPGVVTPLAYAAIESSRIANATDDRSALLWQHRLGASLIADGRTREAKRVLEETAIAAEDTDPETFYSCLNDLASLELTSDPQRALERIDQVLEYRQRSFGKEDFRTLSSLHTKGLVLGKLGRHAEASRLLRKVANRIDNYEEFSVGQRLSMKSNAAVQVLRTGQFQEALTQFEALYPQYIAELGPSHPDTVSALLNIAAAERELGQFDAAADKFRQVIQIRQMVLGREHEHYWHAHLSLALTEMEAGRFEDAFNSAEPALRWYVDNSNGLYGYKLNVGFQVCAFALIALERFEEAEPLVTQWRDWSTQQNQPSFDLLLASGEVAVALQNLGQAREFANQAAAQPGGLSDIESAALSSLRAAVHLTVGKLKAADEELQAASTLVEREADLSAHQVHWPELVRRRQAVLSAKQDQ